MNEKSPLALVSGGAGFVGSHLVDALLKAGYRVRVLDDLSTGRRENLSDAMDAIDLIVGSIVDVETCEAAVDGVRVVFHQAAVPSVPRSLRYPLVSHQACATGTLNLLNAAATSGVARFIYAASSSAYGDVATLPKVETMRPRPKSPYAVAKLAGEHYVTVWNEISDLCAISLRYFNIFGPRQDPASQYAAVIAKFVDCGMANDPPTIYGDGNQTRDFTYVENAVEANLLAATAPAEDIGGRVFNVGCGESTSVNEVWTMVRNLTGATVDPRYEAAREGDVRESLAGLEAARRGLGYVPSVSVEEGLRRTVALSRLA